MSAPGYCRSMQNISTAAQLRALARSVILDGALDPEFVLGLEDFDTTDPADLAYLRLVTSVNIGYKTFGDDYLRDLGLDPIYIVF